MMATASETSGGSASPNEVDLYIQAFPEPVREKLEAMRRIIREEVPQAREKISYRMPTYELFGNLVHFAGYARHIGFYPTPSAIEAFKLLMQDDEFAQFFVSDLGLSLLFSVLGIGYQVYALSKAIKRRKAIQ